MASTDLLLILLGALGFIVLRHQAPILRGLGDIPSIKLEDIEGIDLNALNIARQKGLM